MFGTALCSMACVRFEGLMDMPPGSASDPAVYGSGKKEFPSNVAKARLLVRSSNLTWALRGTAGENLASSREIREKYAGVIFVGDSQIREIAWAALQMLTVGQTKRFFEKDRVFARQRAPGKSACVPQTIGKTGFTASCGALSPDLGGTGEACELHSPFRNKTHAEQMRKLLLTKPHLWDGKLSVSDSVCDSDFFVTYAATWGAMPVDPATLPTCLHPKAGSRSANGEEQYSLLHKRSGRVKPVLWIIDGCGLHEMEFCDARRWFLPQSVLPKFSDSLLRSGTVVWQTVGAGFLMKVSRRFKGECESINADQVAAKEAAYLRSKSVPYYNYTALALQYAPMMFDAIHFTYYWVPCAYTFPEMARLVAQLGFQQAVGRPVEVCPPNTPDSSRSSGGSGSSSSSGGSVVLGSPGGSFVSLAQDRDQADAAYSAAFKLSGKPLPAGMKGKHAAAKVSAAENDASASAGSSSSSASATSASSAADASSAGGGGAGGDRDLASAIKRVASEFGGKKRSEALEQAITRLAKRFGGQA